MRHRLPIAVLATHSPWCSRARIALSRVAACLPDRCRRRTRRVDLPCLGLGFVFVVLNFLGMLFTLFLVDSWRIRLLVPEWSKGTLYFRAGWLANLNNQNTAFNMGNFTFVDFESKSAYRDHEPLHGLSLAAFGWVFHLVGFVDEIILDNDNAYSERLADKVIPMWA